MNSLHVKDGIEIPMQELKIIASRSGGSGGQHVNKTETKITIKWNIKKTMALSDPQKKRVLTNLKNKLTKEGELIIHNSESRSQQQNKENALKVLAKTIELALHIPKKRIPTKVPQKERERRLAEKKHRSEIKKMRKIKY